MVFMFVLTGCHHRNAEVIQNAPQYFRLDADDTYTSDYELTGSWVYEKDHNTKLLFNEDGTFESNNFVGKGRYSLGAGYVILKSEDTAEEWLRVVNRNGTIILQRDTNTLPVVFIPDHMSSLEGEQENTATDLDRDLLTIAAVKDILHQCVWTDIEPTASLRGVSFGNERIYSRDGMRVIQQGEYSITTATVDESSYHASGVIAGQQVKIHVLYICIPAGEQYVLTIENDNGDQLVNAMSRSSVAFTLE